MWWRWTRLGPGRRREVRLGRDDSGRTGAANNPTIKTQTKPSITHLAFLTRDYALVPRGGEKSAGGFFMPPRKALKILANISLKKSRPLNRHPCVKHERSRADSHTVEFELHKR